jgi:hypothetical protein
MTNNAIVVAGIEIPSDLPFFVAVVAIHVGVGLICVVTGIIAMLSEKRPGRHPTFGSIYFWSLSLVFASAAILSAIRWREDYHLFVLGALSFTTAALGRHARRRRWHSWARLHVIGMGSSYILLLTAFYVDNGKSLPLWKELPAIAYWLFPSAVGIPLIVRTLSRHPVVNRSE